MKKMNFNEFKDYVMESDILEILTKADIVSEDDIDNANKMSCPFHDEKTPSLQFYDHNYYCFGCQASGTAFTFVRETYDCSFVDACAMLAENLGIELNLDSIQWNRNPFLPRKSFNKVDKDLLQKEWDTYVENLSKAPKQIQQGASIFFPLKVGYDNKMNYYVLRYTSKQNKTLGFTKRRAFEIDDEKDKGKFPKWKHSRSDDSNIGQCSSVFNLGDAVRHIRNKNHVIVTEGPKDIIPFLLNNQKEVVAMSGTSNVSGLLNVIPKVDKYTLALDGDAAGRKAELKIICELANEKSLENFKCINFGELDPYDYYEENGELPEPIELVDFFAKEELKQIYNASSLYNKNLLLEHFIEKQGVTYDEAVSFFEMGKEKAKKINKQDEIDKLVEQGDELALKKLKMKYGID